LPKTHDAPANRLTVELQDGTERTYHPRRQQGVSVFRVELRPFSEGDRVLFTAPANDLRVASREFCTLAAKDLLNSHMVYVANAQTTVYESCFAGVKCGEANPGERI